MELTTLNPPALGAPLAPYSQAMLAGSMLYVSGQVALDAGGAVVAPGDVAAQTAVVLRRLSQLLAEVGSTLADVVTTTVFLASLDGFDAYNAAWVEAFGDHRPARATVQAGLALPALAVEVQAIAIARSVNG